MKKDEIDLVSKVKGSCLFLSEGIKDMDYAYEIARKLLDEGSYEYVQIIKNGKIIDVLN